MPGDILNTFVVKIENALGRWTSHIFWPYIAIALAVLIVLLSCVPRYDILPEIKASHHAKAIEWWLEHPAAIPPVERFYPGIDLASKDPEAGYASHFDKLTFRITLPLICQIFPFGLWTPIVASHLAAIGCFVLIYNLVLGYRRDAVAATLATWTFASSFVGQWGFKDSMCGDAIAYFLLLLALVDSGLWLTLLSMYCAAFVDERAILAIPLVLSHHWFARSSHASDACTDGPTRSRRLRAIWGACAAAVLYFLTRYLLIHFRDLHMGTSMLATTEIISFNFLNSYPWPFFNVFRGLWLILIMFLLHIWSTHRHGRFLFIALICAAAPVLGAAFAVVDFERSAAYLVPGILSALLFSPVESLRFRRLLCYGFIFSFFLSFPAEPILRIAAKLVTKIGLS